MIVNALIAALGLLAVALVITAFAVLRDPKATRRRVESIFRRPEKPRPLTADHYYKHYWS